MPFMLPAVPRLSVFSRALRHVSPLFIRSVILRSSVLLASVLFTGVLAGCVTLNQREFKLASDEDSTASRAPAIYLTGTKNIAALDSAARTRLFLDIWKVEDEDYPQEIRLFARVMDSSGNFIAGMAPPYMDTTASTAGSPAIKDYRHYWTRLTQILGGDTVQVTNFNVREYGDADSVAYAIGLTLDHGGSMGGTISILQEAARMFVGLKYPQDRLALVKFDNNVRTEVPLSTDTLAFAPALSNNDLRGYGLYTALYDAIKQTILEIAPKPVTTATLGTASSTTLGMTLGTTLGTTRNVTNASLSARALADTLPRALVIFTDGEDNASKTTEAEIYQLARKYNIRLFPVGFGYINDDALRNLAAFTGGRYYKVFSKNELLSVFKDIYKGLRNFYKIRYKPDEFAGEHIVELAVNTSNYNDSNNRFKRRYERGGDDREDTSDGRNKGVSGLNGNGNKNGNGNNGNDGSGNKNGSGLNGNGNNGNGNNGDGKNKNGNGNNGNDGSGNKNGSGLNGNGNNGNGNNGDGKNKNGNGNNGNDGSGNKNGSGLDGNGNNGNSNNGDGKNKNGNGNNGNDGSGNKNGSGLNGNDNNGNNGNGNNGNNEFTARVTIDKSGIKSILDSAAFSRNILFDFRKADIRSESMIIIKELAAAMRRYGQVRVLEVRGHTDSIGTDAFNRALSELRAQSVVQELVRFGVEQQRLRPLGFGSTRPVAPNDSEENRQRNRRTEFAIRER
jgi:outer membrane protein OmpA-like peptidoglycan-associated protein